MISNSAFGFCYIATLTNPEGNPKRILAAARRQLSGNRPGGQTEKRVHRERAASGRRSCSRRATRRDPQIGREFQKAAATALAKP
jgi:hypothetical protein